jgi:hypothetical protein
LRPETNIFYFQLAMGVLATLFGSTYLAARGPSKQQTATPPINASSSDEEDFIKCDPYALRGDPVYMSKIQQLTSVVGSSWTRQTRRRRRRSTRVGSDDVISPKDGITRLAMGQCTYIEDG